VPTNARYNTKDHLERLCEIAEAYYHGHMPKKWIASAFRMSIESVSRSLRRAEAEGIVEVIVRSPLDLIYDESVALVLVDNRIRLVSVSADGQYQFLDNHVNWHNILYVVSAETLALQRAIEELEILVNDPKTNEKDLQIFFEKNPNFILNEDYKHAHAHIVLAKNDGETLIPDFVLEPADQSSLCDLLELKLPSAEIFVLRKQRIRFSSAVLEACAQLRTYSEFFDDQENRQRIQERYGLLAYRPKMFVIIGRRGNVNPLDVRRAESDLPGLALHTYDDVIRRTKTKIEAMKSGRYLRQFGRV
jgi:hypothetical protein